MRSPVGVWAGTIFARTGVVLLGGNDVRAFGDAQSPCPVSSSAAVEKAGIARMTAMLTSDDLAARTDRAVAAAVGAGRDLGLTVTDPRVLYDMFSVVVHLFPAPVVVRVPTVLPRSVAADPDVQAAQQRSELAAAGWLADRGHPVVPPSPLMAREPVRRDGSR